MSPRLPKILLAALMSLSPRGDAPPRDLGSLVAFLEARRTFNTNLNNLLAQWGPTNRRLLGAEFLPPRLVERNADTIERVAWRTIAAQDGTRHSPAQIVGSQQLFGSITYRLHNSDIARQVTGRDYDAIVRYLNSKLPMAAATALLGFFDAMIIQALAEHDELAIWDAIVHNSQTLRGDNGYFEYTNGPNLTDHRVVASEDWSDPEVNPWLPIIARVMVLTGKSFEKTGIRVVITDQVRTILKNNPFTAVRVGKSQLVMANGQVTAQSLNGVISDEELDNAFRALGVQAPITHDLRIPTRTGEKRAVPEGSLTLIASTNRTEEVAYNVDNPAEVRIVENTIGFNGIGIANGQNAPGRRSAVNAFTNQKDARIEMEGWQETGPVIEVPEAVSGITGIQ